MKLMDGFVSHTVEGRSTLLSRAQVSSNMEERNDLSTAEKRQTVQCLGQGVKSLGISGKLECDHNTTKRFVV